MAIRVKQLNTSFNLDVFGTSELNVIFDSQEELGVADEYMVGSYDINSHSLAIFTDHTFEDYADLIGTLAHECLHAADGAIHLHNLDINPNEYTSETRCYISQYFLKSIMRVLEVEDV